ncbi:hypothetical protein LR48_Vigan107s001000 [Vigna angularis]|uniref:Uncharacterized protein n=1 Tax=Phaseolus angularis TaxID=3914 RepID=A0A0L9T588_PHAAN|nr:hypothetical protein LR48_Vigan107s001000 [Vigna angularis]
MQREWHACCHDMMGNVCCSDFSEKRSGRIIFEREVENKRRWMAREILQQQLSNVGLRECRFERGELTQRWRDGSRLNGETPGLHPAALGTRQRHLQQILAELSLQFQVLVRVVTPNFSLLFPKTDEAYYRQYCGGKEAAQPVPPRCARRERGQAQSQTSAETHEAEPFQMRDMYMSLIAHRWTMEEFHNVVAWPEEPVQGGGAEAAEASVREMEEDEADDDEDEEEKEDTKDSSD